MSRGVPLSRRAAVALGALTVYTKPKLAQDARVDLTEALAGVTAKNWSARKAGIPAALKSAVSGKLAQDAEIDLGEVADLLDSIDDGQGAAPGVPGAPGVVAAPDEPDSLQTDTVPPVEQITELLKSAGVSDDLIAQVAALLAPQEAPPKAEAPPKPVAPPKAETPPPFPPAAKDTPPPTPGTPPAPGGEVDKKDDLMPETVTKSAMDAAIACVSRDVEASTIARLNAIHKAQDEVRPVIGTLASQPMSADDVYKLALDSMEGVDLNGVPAAAYGALFREIAKVRAVASKPAARMATDSSASADFLSRFPGAARLRVL